MTNSTAPARWSKSNPSWGSALRVQRNVYALRVMLAMTGGAMVCPTCGVEWDNTFEVDRVDPALDYCEGNIVYVCRANCNGPRGELQSRGLDWTHVDQYAADVRDASARVTVPGQTEARREWDARATGRTRTSRYA